MTKYFRFIASFAAASLIVGPTKGLLVSQAHAAQNTEQGVQKKIQDYLNAITTLTADFSQNNPDGSRSSGRFYLKRSKTGYGKMRLEYNPPVKLLLVSNGELLMQHDLESDSVSSYSIDSTPAALLLQPNINFSKDATIRKIQMNGNLATLTLSRAKGNDGSSLTVTFSLTPTVELKEWTVLDSQGNRTHVSFRNVRLGTQLPEKLFVVNR